MLIPREGFGALGAGKLPLIGVSPLVSGELGLSWKGPAAARKLARIGTLTSVEDHVGLELRFLAEHFPTHRAGGLTGLGVTPDVSVERGLTEVGLATALHCTPQVGLHLQLVSLTQVQLPLPLSLKLGLAFLAREGETPGVKLEVRVEVVDRGEALLTALDVAGEVLLTAVTQLVPVELVPGHEGPAAARLVAVERFNVVMREEM